MNTIQLLEGYHIFGNSLLSYAVALGIVVGVYLVSKLFEKILLVRLRRLSAHTKTTVDDLMIDAIRDIGTLFYLALGVWIGTMYITLTPTIETIIRIFVLATVTYQAIRLLLVLARFVLHTYATKEGTNSASESMVHIGMIFVQIAVWSIGGLFILSNLGVDVTALVASLGIGSLAIALALQNILGDMFSSFSLYADKPFEIGDYIVVGTDGGTVKQIGLKSTRITTLQGEELVVPNKELTSVRVQNYKRMQRRRVSFTFGVVYGTRADVLKGIPDTVEHIISSVDHLAFDRCHFHEFGDSALLFEVVYYVDSQEYETYMDTRQAVNLALLTSFEKDGIAFAYPTQTLYIEK